MSKPIRIGTRDSELALWQANTVKDKLELLGYKTELVAVKSTGDLNLDQPLYELGITGIFTKTLDIAMLNRTVDIAVHSMKDVPTLLPKGIVQSAVLERAASEDVLVTNGDFNPEDICTVATGSLRRKAQWLSRYPHHKVVGLRGNVNTRLQKLVDSDWQGAVFAKAGLERIDKLPENHRLLDWMIPAPAQGAMVVVARQDDLRHIDATQQLDHKPSAICTEIEREFLQVLEGGCTAPIGALAIIEGELIRFKAVLLSLDGRTALSMEKEIETNNYKGCGAVFAREMLANGGAELMNTIKKSQ
ncbi:hydroxymethylbilane synthase [Pukyongia salina]|uniref:Hydroxymethylbilane synthase n=1 Tax=Pukyongia salina TaxID=2094025 RepID=A0A2S0HVX2_9FLAO|nr:hydroxymethylbilane synthase [Pukyongia salina]AVI50684.1 hydroxymethylbilane synthase [Pukyongia salina]